MSIRKPLILSLAITTALAAANAPAVGGAGAGTAAHANGSDLPPLAAFRSSDLDPGKNACANLAD